MAAVKIWKAQRPLNGHGPILMYTKDSRHQPGFVQPGTEFYDQIMEALGDDLKLYAPGRMRNGTLELSLKEKLDKHPNW